MKKPKLLLIDSSALIYRAFYALPPLTDKQGRVVNAVYGFMSAFLNVLKQTEPNHVVFAFDSPKPTLRKEKYHEYKAHREKAPDELYSQIPISKDLVRKLGFTELEKAGFEADDIIATCAKRFLEKHEAGEVVVATGDLDTLQLVDPRTKVFALSRGITEAKLYDEKAVRERFGLDPDQMNDFKALFGDPSDNIKGVKGIGKKTAAELLRKYQTLEGIYGKLDELKPRLREILEREKEQAFLSRELVILEKDVPLDLDLEKTGFSLENLASKKEYFEELSFNSLAKRVHNLGQKITKEETSPLSPPPVGSDLKSEPENSRMKGSSQRLKPTEALKGGDNVFPFKRGGGQARQMAGAGGVRKEITYIENNAALEKLKLNHFVFWSGECEKKEGLAIGVISDKKLAEIYFVTQDAIPELDKSLPKESMGFGFDLKEVGKDIFPAKRILKKSEDLKLKAYLIQPPLIRKFGFKEIVWHFLKERWEEPKRQMNLLEQSETGYNREKIGEMLDLLVKLSLEVESAFREQISFQEQSSFIPEIFPAIENKIKKRSIDYVYKNIEKPLSRVLGLMEMAGVRINLDLLKELREKNARSLDGLKKKIYQLSGKEFNLDSPSQLADVLFRDLDISSADSKRGKSGHYSTAAGVLEKLRDKHPIISSLLDYREQRKFQTTYLDVIPKLVSRENDRLHTTFDQTGAATGRLSSNNPNLQNIPLQPIDKEKNIGLRHAFVAEKGFKLVSLDYSQIEIRLAAYLSGEEKLIKAFERGEDIHRQTAAFVNQIAPEKVTTNLRNAAKALNFGIMYGMSPFGFSESSKLPEHEARAFIQNYFREFPRIAGYIDKTKEFAREYGFVETVFGRRRYVPEVNLENRILRQAGERMAINMPLQGTAADIMKLALVKVQEYLDKNTLCRDALHLCRDALQCGSTTETDARILLSIHDEIILEVRNNLVEKIAREVREIMENVASDILPLKVDVEIGENWGEI